MIYSPETKPLVDNLLTQQPSNIFANDSNFSRSSYSIQNPEQEKIHFPNIFGTNSGTIMTYPTGEISPNGSKMKDQVKTRRIRKLNNNILSMNKQSLVSSNYEDQLETGLPNSMQINDGNNITQPKKNLNEKIDKFSKTQIQARNVLHKLRKFIKTTSTKTKAQENLNSIPQLVEKLKKKNQLQNEIIEEQNSRYETGCLTSKHHKRFSQGNTIEHRNMDNNVNKLAELCVIKNYQQNNDFHNYVSIFEDKNTKYLRVRSVDFLTFFRLQHELTEIKRKKVVFEQMKFKHFTQKDPNKLIEYDQNLRIQNNYGLEHLQDSEFKIKQSKGYLKGIKIAEKLRAQEQKKIVFMSQKTLLKTKESTKMK